MVLAAGIVFLNTRYQPLAEAAAPLNQGWYDAATAKARWDTLRAHKLEGMEREVLLLDLGFPVLYGAAFATALLIAHRALDWQLGTAMLLAPVALGVAADWAENAIQLTQLDRTPIDPGWIQVAATATLLKLGGLAIAGAVCLFGAYALVRR